MKYLHTTIFTDRLEESIAFYEEQVGLRILRDLRGNPEHRTVFLGNAQGETCIELAEAGAKPAADAAGISLGFQVADAEAERAKKEAAGLHPGEMVMPNPNAKFFCIEDPNGVEIQFLEEKS